MIITSNLVDYFQIGAVANILYEGTAFASDSMNDNLTDVLFSDENAYSSDGSTIYNTGDKLKLVSVYQSRHNSRVLISGSISMFSNKSFYLSAKGKGHEKGDNYRLAQGLIDWTLGRRGVIKVDSVKLEGQKDNTDTFYRVGTEVKYEVKLVEWNSKIDKWRAYVVDNLEIEVVLLEVIYRMPLKHLGGGRYEIVFKAPEEKGVYKLNVNYHRKGFSNIIHTTKMILRENKHDEVERFRYDSFPFYCGYFGIVMGSFVFVGMLIAVEENKEKTN